LTANPRDAILLNNLAFMYASSGTVDVAKEEFDKIERDQVKELSHEIAITATQGLLEFRSGNPLAGRARYTQAIALATGEEFRTSRALASIYLAREELLAQTENALKALELASREIRRLSDPDSAYCQLILDRVKELGDHKRNVLANCPSGSV
jgi:hypothetical protein